MSFGENAERIFNGCLSSLHHDSVVIGRYRRSRRRRLAGSRQRIGGPTGTGGRHARRSGGARNVLNSPAPNSSGLTDMQFEDLLGRVPYVRYKQDL